MWLFCQFGHPKCWTQTSKSRGQLFLSIPWFWAEKEDGLPYVRFCIVGRAFVNVEQAGPVPDAFDEGPQSILD